MFVYVSDKFGFNKLFDAIKTGWNVMNKWLTMGPNACVSIGPW